MEAKPKRRKTGESRSTSGAKSKTTRSKRTPTTPPPPPAPARQGITPEAVIAWIRANEEAAIITSFCIGILIGAYMQD